MRGLAFGNIISIFDHTKNNSYLERKGEVYGALEKTRRTDLSRIQRD